MPDPCHPQKNQPSRKKRKASTFVQDGTPALLCFNDESPTEEKPMDERKKWEI
jgi:hypothetical protein